MICPNEHGRTVFIRRVNTFQKLIAVVQGGGESLPDVSAAIAFRQQSSKSDESPGLVHTADITDSIVHRTVMVHFLS